MIKKAYLKVKITSISPEDFINFISRQGFVIKNLKKDTIVNYIFDIESKDYIEIKGIAQDKNVKIKVIDGTKEYRLRNKIKKRKAFMVGILAFVGIIYYLSTHIWVININTENYVSPYEIRTYLGNIGIKPGIKKNMLDVFKLENLIQEENKNVVWVRARIEGTKLDVNILERQNPPNIEEDKSPCDLVAKKDGEIQRVYTKSGTSIVEEGQIVKKGDILVRGVQGKEESTYEVKAEGKVMAKTFYEDIKNIKIPKVNRVRTGNKIVNRYIVVKDKKIYFKKNLNKFDKYDRIEDNNSLIKKEIYYEIKEESFTKDQEEKLVKDTLLKMYSDITINFNHDIKVVQKVEDKNRVGDEYKLRVLVIAEEDIGERKNISHDNPMNDIVKKSEE